MPRIIIIDDDLDICILLKRFLTKNGYEVHTAHTGKKGLSILQKKNFDIVLCDFRLPDSDGLEMIPKIKAISSTISIVIITGYSDVKMAVKVMQKGAFEYVTKPIIPEEILHTLKQALLKSEASLIETKEVVSALKKSKRLKTDPKYVIGTGAKSKRIQELISLVAPTNMTVVITGESGTGKEVTAKTIHERSKRYEKRIIAVDCGAIPKGLVGSVLFGHLKGSFTGALADKVGHFEAADKGTLFLDEIGNLSYENQVSLLRVLQERKIQKIGDIKEVSVDVRVIAATNENLREAVDKGEFREDLFYRLNEFNIELPSLHECQEDIAELSMFLLKKSAQELEKNVTKFDQKVITAFKKYTWPGNIRELQNVVKRATLLTRVSKITLESIPQEIQNPTLFSFSEDENQDPIDLKSVSELAEKKAILKVLKLTGFNKSKSAKLLKVDRKTLYNKIRQYEIELP